MPSKMKSLDKRFSLCAAEKRFRTACDQIVLLNQRLGDVQKRYKLAKRSGNKAFRYNLRLKLAVIEGCRNMFYDYAYNKADQVADLRRDLFDEYVEIVSASDTEYMSDSDYWRRCKSFVVIHQRHFSAPTILLKRSLLQLSLGEMPNKVHVYTLHVYKEHTIATPHKQLSVYSITLKTDHTIQYLLCSWPDSFVNWQRNN